MKKLITICFFIATVFTVTAQTKGPTKEQTIAFIKDYYDNNPMIISLITDTQVLRKGYESMNIDFSSSNNLMIINFVFTYDYKSLDSDIKRKYKTGSKIILDLSKIEKISFYSPLGISEGTEIVPRMQFKTMPNAVIQEYVSDKNLNFPGDPKKVTTILIPTGACDNCNFVEANKKILQAFDHLRKLCGAPEPIDFGN